MKYVLIISALCLGLVGCGGGTKVASKGVKALKLPKGGKAPKLPKGGKGTKLKNEKTFGEHLKGKLKSQAEEAILDVAIEEQRKANLQSHYNSGGGRALIGKPVKTIVSILGPPASWKKISYGYLLYTYNIEGPDSKGLRFTLKPDGTVTDATPFYVRSSVPQPASEETVNKPTFSGVTARKPTSAEKVVGSYVLIIDGVRYTDRYLINGTAQHMKGSINLREPSTWKTNGSEVHVWDNRRQETNVYRIDPSGNLTLIKNIGYLNGRRWVSSLDSKFQNTWIKRK